jgi:hypothetical protein
MHPLEHLELASLSCPCTHCCTPGTAVGPHPLEHLTVRWPPSAALVHKNSPQPCVGLVSPQQPRGGSLHSLPTITPHLGKEHKPKQLGIPPAKCSWHQHLWPSTSSLPPWCVADKLLTSMSINNTLNHSSNLLIISSLSATADRTISKWRAWPLQFHQECFAGRSVIG